MTSTTPRASTKRWSTSLEFRPRGLVLFCAILTAVALSEALRLILHGATTQVRWGGWYLLAVSALIALGALPSSDSRRAAAPPAENSTDRVAPGGTPRRNVAVFFVSVIVFAWALPWVGFAIANFVFVSVYLKVIDRRPWHTSLAVAAIVDSCLVLGMDRLNVLLPAGVFGIGL